MPKQKNFGKKHRTLKEQKRGYPKHLVVLSKIMKSIPLVLKKNEVCEMAHVTLPSLNAHIKRKHIKIIKLPGGHIRFPYKEATKFCRYYGRYNYDA